jgi:hypothetical protein
LERLGFWWPPTAPAQPPVKVWFTNPKRWSPNQYAGGQQREELVLEPLLRSKMNQQGVAASFGR